VVVIGFFQLRCPASRTFSIPLLQHWRALYRDREDVVIVLVHSVFTEHEQQSPSRLRAFLRETGIVHPVGIDAYDGAQDDVPVTLRRFEAGGTPHLVIVNRDGMVRFTHFGIFAPGPVEALIERLLEEPRGTFGRMFAAAPSAEASRSQPDRGLSGAYVFRTDPATGACANWVPASEVPAELRVFHDTIEIEFIRPLIGMGAMEATYHPETGRVEGAGVREIDARGGGASDRVTRLEGVLDRDAEPPEMEFRLSFLNGKCAVEGRARGAR
jgi:hypothetical protein